MSYILSILYSFHYNYRLLVYIIFLTCEIFQQFQLGKLNHSQWLSRCGKTNDDNEEILKKNNSKLKQHLLITDTSQINCD